MDLAKIGVFIKECRKEKNLTQVQLSVKIGVSEKTISKWECGNGFPDATLMLPLCQALDITANELLSGAKLSSDKEYKKLAENNLVNLKKEQEKTTRFLLTLECVLGIMSTIVLLLCVGIASFVNLAEGWRVAIIIGGLLVCMVGWSFCMTIEKDAGFYECQHCHHKYVPTLRQMYLARHMGRTRYMKCSKCNKKSWQKKTINKD